MSDLPHAARALYGVPHEQRGAFCARLVWRAHVADKYVKRLEKLHPHWGDGSLRAVALGHSALLRTTPNTGEMLACMAVVVQALQARRRQE